MLYYFLECFIFDMFKRKYEEIFMEKVDQNKV